MKKKQGLLVMALGCLVTVTAVAGVLMWRGTGSGGRDDVREETEDTREQLSWNSEETETKEEAKEETRETKEETKEETAEETTGRETEHLAQSALKETEPSADEEQAPAAAQARSVSFSEADRLSWPVEGSVIMDFSMDRTVYFPTLEEYKCSPAVLIQSEVGTQVKAPADALVKVVGSDEERGNYLTLDLGGGYELTIGQMENIALSPGDYAGAGTVMGTVAAPTKYYVVEGPNLYVQMTKDGAPIDPLDYME